MLYKTLTNKDKHIIRHTRPFQGILLKLTSLEGTPSDLDELTVSAHVDIPGQRKIELGDPISVNDYGLCTSIDAQGNNQYNIDEKPTREATKGYTHWRMINFTPNGNIPLLEDEEVVITFENCDGWEIQVNYDEATYTSNYLWTVQKSTLKSGINVTQSLRREHYMLMTESMYTSPITYEYANRAQLEVSPSEHKFKAYTTDYVGLRQYVNGENILEDVTTPSGKYMLDLTALNGNPIVGLKYDNIDADKEVVTLIVMQRKGNELITVKK